MKNILRHSLTVWAILALIGWVKAFFTDLSCEWTIYVLEFHLVFTASVLYIGQILEKK